MSVACDAIHRLMGQFRRHSFSFDEDALPLNGIYVLFQAGEEGHDGGRIVRIGTHTGKNQLRSRLKQHFLTENKDRSVFRKNIGRAILKQNNDPFLKQWEVDLTTREKRIEYARLMNLEYLKQVEQRVSRFIRDNFTFIVFEVNSQKKRLEIESKLISTVSLCKDCRPSSNWLGNQSPKSKIVESGLWLVNELYKTPFSASEIGQLSRSLKMDSQWSRERNYFKKINEQRIRNLDLPLSKRIDHLVAGLAKMDRIRLEDYADFLGLKIDRNAAIGAIRKLIATELRKQIEGGSLIVD